MSTYTQRLNAHLASYKTSRLGVHEPGTFAYRGNVLPYNHILPKEKQWLNILEPFRSEIRQYLAARRAIKLHRYFHHLNSSQAFALNLFFPYLERGGASQLLGAFGTTGELSSWEPECIVDASEGTNVDIIWEAGGTRTYCEVKLSEQDFGSAQNDCAHREKLERIYKPSLVDVCPPELLQPEVFFQNYQLLRNVWLVARDPGSTLVFLLPRANTRIWRQLAGFLTLLPHPLADRVRAVAVEDAVASLESAENLPAVLAGYAELLREKYMPPADA
jgi:hypothetical protein